ncbi:MAG TPA: glycosyltransferase family 9 protein, partial [Desulfocapsa sulfexigens]|nr:glycosyltransferase family 9 protein [Desulfocapsa sulfexigens]
QTFAPLLECDPAIDTVYPIHISSTSDPEAGRMAYLHAFKEMLGTLITLRSQFKQARYDLILDLHASFRSGFFGWTNPGGIRIGFKDARELNTFFQNQLITVPEHVKHALEKNVLFCDHLGCSVAEEDFHMHSKSGDVESVRTFLDTSGITDEDDIIYANPCARWESKFWPAEYWAALADRLYEQGLLLVFAGSGGDRNYIAQITAQMQSKPFIAAGELGLTQVVALLQRCAAYVGLDSGPMHMAAMTQTPVVALFGPTHPERVRPYGVKHVIMRNEKLDCLECRKRQCSHLSCMKGIKVGSVVTAVTDIMKSA